MAYNDFILANPVKLKKALQYERGLERKAVASI